MTITVTHTISMGHRLPSYKGICSSPHGHNIKVEASIEVANFMDFKYVSDLMRKLLEPLDHAMVLYEADPLLPLLKNMDFRTFALNVEPTTEALASFMFRLFCGHGLSGLRCVTVYETDRYSATATELGDVYEVVL